MNLNLVAYGIYGVLTVVITVFVGRSFHKSGIHYILDIFKESSISHAINNILLIGYYLVNIGFAILKINTWNTVENSATLIEGISENVALLMILLGILNIFNIAVLSFFRKNSNQTSTF